MLPTAGIRQLAWMQGCWQMNTAGTTVEEQWMAPRGKSMLGMGRTVREDRLVTHELVLLRESGTRLEYEAHPSGQAGTVFTSSQVTGSSVHFENPQHDFPQKVGYQLEGRDGLLAWIEGPIKGETRRIEFKYTRVPCPGSP